jgi:peptidoglycan-N-acetylglucosamine deacetylase
MMTAPAVVLTFDDGPGPSTERLLDVLARHRARATFFVLGRNLLGAALNGDGARARAIASRAVREGHLLGNHTMSHAAELTTDDLLAEVAACDALVGECQLAAGLSRPPAIPIRLPFGPDRPDGARALAALAGIGRPHCHWSGDPLDWRPGRTAEEIAGAVIGHLEHSWSGGGVPTVLLHDGGQGPIDGEDRFGVAREATVDAVAAVCASLSDRGVRYLSVLEVPAWDKSSRFPLPGRCKVGR